MDYNFTPENCWYRDVCGLYKADRCDNHCIRFSQMKHLITASCLPKTLCYPVALEPQTVDLPAFIQLAEIKENIVDFVNNGQNLYIYSCNTGNGKTSWSAKLMLKYFDEIWHINAYSDKGIFVSVSDFLVNMRLFGYNNTKNETLIQKIKNLDIVIWDDIAVGQLTAQDLDLLYSLINFRVLHGRSNIFTGNLDGEQLKEIMGSRLYSRIWETSTVIELRGSDRRTR